jgi:hypothetical protein
MVYYRQIALLIFALCSGASAQDTLHIGPGTATYTNGILAIISPSVTIRADSVMQTGDVWFVYTKASTPKHDTVWLPVAQPSDAGMFVRETFSLPASGAFIPEGVRWLSWSYSATTKKISGSWLRRIP